MVIRLHLLHQLPDDPLAVEPVARMGDVHILPVAIPGRAAVGIRQNVRVFPDHPRRNGIGGCADDYGNAILLRTRKHPVQAGEIKFAVPRFPCAPGGFGNADHVHACFLHHAHILVHTGHRHVFIIIGSAKIDFLCPHNSLPDKNAADPAIGRICRFVDKFYCAGFRRK